MPSDSKTDEQIQRDVLAELMWDSRIQPNEIRVSAKNGIVALSGHVDSFYKKWTAEEAALRVRGVAAVVNELEVRLPSSSERTDEEIAAAAVRAIEADTLLGAKNLQITVDKGWITLHGEVDWNFQKEDAEQLLRRLWGVKGVTNLITVKSRPTTMELKDKIEKALLRTAKLDARKISIDVQGAKVSLNGTVRSWAERADAERTAWLAPGVNQVDNRLQVSYTA
ncbi:MAG TPA: BON domain-containing protein [Kofleriaceae bacterium]|jgi:osmotically-inducible protein OsmY|nr:BON domain-containing protein [Kofleriaceae bacterium]